MPAPWYTFPRVDNLGKPDPFGGFPKPDSNIQLAADYPITNILAGTITNIDTQSSWGDAVTIKLDNPLNSLATHEVYLHLANFASGLHIGQHLNVGDNIGDNGGSDAAGSQKVPLGFALYSGDAYGLDSAWSNETVANVTGPLNPVPLLDSIKGGTNIVGYTQNAITDSTGLQNLSNLAGSINTDINSFDYKTFAIRAGLIIVGIIAAILGIYLFVQ